MPHEDFDVGFRVGSGYRRFHCRRAADDGRQGDLPYEETADAISSSRAILIAVAILTVFLAMITLYLIVRYVIVKPLQHLRDVSDEVSRGKMEVRAEIHTNDEFEELGAIPSTACCGT